MNYFRKGNRLSNMVCFGIFKNNSFRFKGVTISISDNRDYCISAEGKHIATVPGDIEYTPQYIIGERLKDPILPPLLV